MNAHTKLILLLTLAAVSLGACAGAKSTRTADPNAVAAAPERRLKPAGARCFFDAECKYGRCAGPGCDVGSPGRCRGLTSRVCGEVTEYCDCDNQTVYHMAEGMTHCPSHRYKHLGACLGEQPPRRIEWEGVVLCTVAVDGRWTTRPCVPPALVDPDVEAEERLTPQ